MNKTLGMLMVLAFVLSVATVAFARGAPTKQKALASNAAVEMVSPTVASVPAMTGYDVIKNISAESCDLSIAENDVDTSTHAGLSSTVGWRGNYSNRSARARSSPMLTLKR